MSEIKPFDINRFAKISGVNEHVKCIYVIPVDVDYIIETSDGKCNVMIKDSLWNTNLTVQELEDEMNRALRCAGQAIEDTIKEELEKRGITAVKRDKFNMEPN